MFECRSCALRCMRAIAGDAVTARQPIQQRLILTPHLHQRISSSSYSTAAGQQVPKGHDALGEVHEGRDIPATKGVQQSETKARGIQIENKKALEMELRWLKDPLKLSEHVKYTLRCEKPDKALDLCRVASKEMNCVVSWNAVIDWLMRKSKINDALKIYNEMKKRAQLPDSYTYMLILRGLGFRSHVSQPVKEENVAKAISIYTSMNAANSRVKPTIMHTNAALNVCALASDMDALWSIASQIPPKGPNAADRITYTIILNAIRFAAFGKNPEGVQLEQLASRRQKAVDEGRRVWLDVIRKWRAGEVAIDENLVAAMGRLLLSSKRIEDWDNVLDLVQQTMDIKRLVAPVGSAERQTQHVPQEPLPESAVADNGEVDEDGFTDSPAKKAFNAVSTQHAKPKGARSLAWAQPGPQTISLLIDACQYMRVPKISMEYWQLLTTEYSVQPDLENFNRQLSLLALNRSSYKAVKLLSEDLPAAGIEPQNSTFRSAMKACQRDMNNPRVLEHATTIIDVMEKTAADPDPQTLMEYLSLALTTDDGPKIVAVINRMDSILHNLRSRVTYGPDSKKSEVADVRELKQCCIFVQSLIGVIDTLMHRELVPQKDFQHWHARRADLQKFLQSTQRRVERRDAKLQPSPEGNRKLGKPIGLVMGNDAWAVRKFRYNDPKRKAFRKEKLRDERDAFFNPPRSTNDEGDKGFGMS
ncbi:hypothetical protein WHR41_01740 [Cladosporium halotolerans]|uniref:Pentatricopeptide repeat protein n=1 Tax=Cladosporium halotolerans TaxID=1052096 RepID=A0AB34L189_9PEZI